MPPAARPAHRTTVTPSPHNRLIAVFSFSIQISPHAFLVRVSQDSQSYAEKPKALPFRLFNL